MLFKTRGFEASRTHFRPGLDMQNKLMIPINQNRSHWTLVMVDPNEKKLDYYDPFHTDGKDILDQILQFIEDLHMQSGLNFDKKSWELKSHFHMPKQTDNNSCGILTILSAECLALNRPADFSMALVTEARRKIRLILATEALLDPYIHDLDDSNS